MVSPEFPGIPIKAALLLQEGGEGPERLMGVGTILVIFFTATTMLVIKGPGVDIVVTVDAQQLPIATIGRVVVVIVVLVVDR